MPKVVRAFPVVPGKENAARAFAAELGGARRQEATAFFKRYGIESESWHLQKTPNGVFIIVVTDLAPPPGIQIHAQAQTYAAAQAPFERWFKDNVKALSGVDPDTQPLGPPTEAIFDWAGG